LIIHLSFIHPWIRIHAMIIHITPLNPLQKEYADGDREAVFVNADNKTPELLKDIKAKKYRRIYMGPEQLQCDDARPCSRLVAYIIDEAHVVTQWGSTFRPVYETLCQVRHLDTGCRY
jgi:ATP-dependent DNA helicase RecQ